MELVNPPRLDQCRLAKVIDMPTQGISEIIAHKPIVTPDMDLRRCRFFQPSTGYWLRARVHGRDVVLEGAMKKRGIIPI